MEIPVQRLDNLSSLLTLHPLHKRPLHLPLKLLHLALQKQVLRNGQLIAVGGGQLRRCDDVDGQLGETELAAKERACAWAGDERAVGQAEWAVGRED